MDNTQSLAMEHFPSYSSLLIHDTSVLVLIHGTRRGGTAVVPATALKIQNVSIRGRPLATASGGREWVIKDSNFEHGSHVLLASSISHRPVCSSFVLTVLPQSTTWNQSHRCEGPEEAPHFDTAIAVHLNSWTTFIAKVPRLTLALN